MEKNDNPVKEELKSIKEKMASTTNQDGLIVGDDGRDWPGEIQTKFAEAEFKFEEGLSDLGDEILKEVDKVRNKMDK